MQNFRALEALPQNPFLATHLSLSKSITATKKTFTAGLAASTNILELRYARIRSHSDIYYFLIPLSNSDKSLSK